MPRYLFQASYTAEGMRGLLKEGGSSRRTAVEQVAESIGASIEAFYYAFGDDDVFLIVDAPDNVTAAAVAIVVNASGAVTAKTTVLMTAEEVDEAIKQTVNYRPPGR